MEKQEILLSMETEFAALDALVRDLDPVLLSTPGVYDDLAIKDVLAHLAAWARLETGWLSASAGGAPVVRFTPEFPLGNGPDDAVMDALNASIVAANRDRPSAAILADWRAAHAALVAAVTALSEATLNDPQAFAWWPGEPVWTSVVGNSSDHYREHRALITAWLAAR